MRWFEQQTDMVLSARADRRHPGDIALQPIIELLELIFARFRKQRTSSLPPCA